eukprot:NODE_2652_length_888_cov_47.864124_g2184_i0.p4 GENE.NODE_2652_length_888_cov_47.864124_g2184_i0~~NODE_2652_length_888_cov_47.864124_g2184_i0.p4  ORF type:complete len:81 (+),score=11.55 NODE_2652_length_888_cov_47.864124_g2184_i0:228-470(+)
MGFLELPADEAGASQTLHVEPSLNCHWTRAREAGGCLGFDFGAEELACPTRDEVEGLEDIRGTLVNGPELKGTGMGDDRP